MKVSVCLITYNHEEFVRQALDSVLAQRAAFDWELVVGVDRSTDRTLAVVDETAATTRARVRVLSSDHRLGLLSNFTRTLAACSGDYIALLDGDDYWSENAKLMRQVSFLDAHPDCSLCFHDTAVMLPDGTRCPQNYVSPGQKTYSGIVELLQTNFIATSAAMLRRSAIGTLPEWYRRCVWEDWPLFILMAERGRIGYLPEVMSVYRNHGRGLWSGLGPIQQTEATIAFLEDINRHLERRYNEDIQRSLARYRERLSDLTAPGQRVAKRR